MLNRKFVVNLIDEYNQGSVSWDEFSYAMKDAHAARMGNPTKRIVMQDKPKEEDYFYSNPHECLK